MANRYLVRVNDIEDGSSLAEFLYETKNEAEGWYEALLEFVNPVSCFVTLEDLWQ